MSARKKVIYLDDNNREARTSTKITNLQSAIVIDRRDFNFWAKINTSALRPRGVLKSEDVNAMIQSLSERVSIMKRSFEKGRAQEVVTLSARISIIATQLGLPRTAGLASQISEAQMAGDKVQVSNLIQKLDDLIESLFKDISC